MGKPKNSPGFGKYSYKKRIWIYNDVEGKEFLAYLRFKGRGYAVGFTQKHFFRYVLDLKTMVSSISASSRTNKLSLRGRKRNRR